MERCPYCQSNLEPRTASIATGEIDGTRTTLRAVARPDLEPASATTPKARKGRIRLGSSASEDRALAAVASGSKAKGRKDG